MKNLILSILALVAIGFFTSGLKNSSSENECSYNKDSMNVVMRFEIKVKPEYVSFLKQSFDECRTKVLEQEPGCLDYSLFQSYKRQYFILPHRSLGNKRRSQLPHATGAYKKTHFRNPGNSRSIVQIKIRLHLLGLPGGEREIIFLMS
jgi:hypothetical protein